VIPLRRVGQQREGHFEPMVPGFHDVKDFSCGPPDPLGKSGGLAHDLSIAQAQSYYAFSTLNLSLTIGIQASTTFVGL
jgi:hypothetical protein